MRVGGKDLLVWSFLMASAHGAGLMLVPVLLAQPTLGMAMAHASMQTMPGTPPATGMMAMALAVVVHTMALLTVAGALAIFFFETYEKVGLKLLRHTWVNFDLLWAFALLIAAFGALLS
jgi:hypothetical protein